MYLHKTFISRDRNDIWNIKDTTTETRFIFCARYTEIELFKLFFYLNHTPLHAICIEKVHLKTIIKICMATKRSVSHW